MFRRNRQRYYKMLILLMVACSFISVAKASAALIQMDMNSQAVYVDHFFQTKIADNWTKAEQFVHDVAVVYKDENGKQLVSLINLDGHKILPYRTDSISIFSLTNDIVQVFQGDSSYLYNTRMNELSPLGDYQVISPDRSVSGIDSNVFLAQQNDSYGFLDGNANCVIPFEWKDARPFSEGLAFVTNDSFTGFINKSGDKIIDSNKKWFSAFPFNEGFSIIMFNSQSIGILNTAGDVVATLEPYHHGYIDNAFHDGFFLVSRGDERYFTDTQGRVLAGKYWKDARCFQNGYAAVMNDDSLWGFIDTKGQITIPHQFDSVDWYYETYSGFDMNGRTWVSIDNSQFLINSQGDKLTTEPMIFCPEFTINDGNQLTNAYVVFDEKISKYGIVNLDGEITYALMYDKIEVLQDNIVVLNTTTEIIFGDTQGNIFFRKPIS